MSVSENTEDVDLNTTKKSRSKRIWDSNQQENNINSGHDQLKYRKNRGGIAKALQYGSPTSDSLDESNSIPLYR